MEIQKLEVDFVRDCFIKLSAVACASGLLALILRYLSSSASHSSKQSCCPISISGSSLFSYFAVLKSLYRRSSKECPIMCLVLQTLCGICQIFESNRIGQFYLGWKPLVLFYKPETVEVVLSSTTIIEKAMQYNLLTSWLGTGLLTSSGEKWRYRRKLLTPAFHFSILEDFLPIFHEQSSVLVSKLQILCKEPWIDIVPLMTACTLDIICETAMGVHVNAQETENNEYVQAIHELGDIFFYRGLRPWLYSDFIFNCCPSGRKFKKHLRRVHEFTRKVIREKKANMIMLKDSNSDQELVANESPSHKRKRRAFLELLLEHHLRDSSLTEDCIREEVDTFMFEGHDTTAMALSWTLYFLGLDGRVQKEVLDELDDIFHDDMNREITREDLTQMKYMECVIKETLRLHPSVPFFGREAQKSFQILNRTVKKGSVCFIFPWMLHRDKDSFEDPEKFLPERFFPENSAGRHPYAYVPFSAGQRNCIGQKFALLEEKTVLANILRRFRVNSLDPRDKVNIEANLLIRNVQPLRLRFTPR